MTRLLDRPAWDEVLRDFGARPLEGKGPLNTAEWWRTPWATPFVLPIDEEGRCLHEDLWRLVADIFRATPPDKWC
jgi:hypothetical protein